MNSLFSKAIRPTLFLDEQKARQNIRFMAEKALRTGVDFRPHFKTHQSHEIGQWFRDEGVKKITVSSLTMAEYFAGYGWKDITLAFPLNLRQLHEIESLATRIKLGILVENEAALKALDSIQSQLGVWIKVDTGLGRTGIPYNQPDRLLDLLSTATKIPNIHIEGILTHAGQTYQSHSKKEIVDIHTESNKRMVRLVDQIHLPELKISIGDTPGCSLVSGFPGIHEIRPGNFVFYDAKQWEMGSCSQDQITVALACPVVANHSARKEVVLYGGAIHFSKESFLHNGGESYGLAVQPSENGWDCFIPDCSIVRLSQEHGILSIRGQSTRDFPVGDLALVVPAHSCLTAHLMRRYVTLDGRILEMMPI